MSYLSFSVSSILPDRSLGNSLVLEISKEAISPWTFIALDASVFYKKVYIIDKTSTTSGLTAYKLSFSHVSCKAVGMTRKIGVDTASFGLEFHFDKLIQ